PMPFCRSADAWCSVAVGARHRQPGGARGPAACAGPGTQRPPACGLTPSHEHKAAVAAYLDFESFTLGGFQLANERRERHVYYSADQTLLRGGVIKLNRDCSTLWKVLSEAPPDCFVFPRHCHPLRSSGYAPP